jgi:hypothetical protein
VRYRKLVFLERAGDDHRVELSDDRTRDDIARKIVASADLNVSLYDNVIEDERLAVEVSRRELAVTRDVLARLDHIDVINTRRMHLGNLSRFADSLRS